MMGASALLGISSLRVYLEGSLLVDLCYYLSAPISRAPSWLEVGEAPRLQIKIYGDEGVRQ